jgi:predicted  nucleic acid-binding Zn-ribbon protein
MADKKITEEELKNAVEFQDKLYKITTDIGVLETRKHALLHDLAGINQDQEKFKKELEAKYGKININLEDGSYTKIEENE